MFEGNIKTCRSRNEFRGYQETFGGYVDSAPKKAEENSGGVVDFSFEKPAIYQLFSKVQGIIHMVNSIMKHFLKHFGAEKEDGLSPFCRYFASKEEIKHELDSLFSNVSKTSNKTTIIDHSDSDQEIINE